MKDCECVEFLQWALPRLRLRWRGFRRVRRQVCKRIGHRLRELGLEQAAYRAYLQDHPAEWQVLEWLCRVTISRFYRDKDIFVALEREVLPMLARRALAEGEDTLRGWSVGCASGEEPYSLVLLWRFMLQERFPALGLHILATDVDPLLLARARRGCYPGTSLKELPQAWRAKAFERVGKEHCLRAEYRTPLILLRHDVREPCPNGRFHLILCRNLVFTYFDSDLQRAILERIQRVLAPGGVLVLGSRERLPEGVAGLVAWDGRLPIYQIDLSKR